jgi:sugar (pentulose or hexulose) kinase
VSGWRAAAVDLGAASGRVVVGELDGNAVRLSEALLRVALESLACKYRQTLDQLEGIMGHPIETIHVVGGGSRNTLCHRSGGHRAGQPGRFRA